VGTPVHAAGDGVIEWAGEFDDSYADNMYWLLNMGGNVAVLNCGDDDPTFIYAHLSTFYVRPGERVAKGQVIALSGNSGYATTGAHLHVEAMPPGYVLNSYLLGRVNPDKYLTEWPENIIEENTLANFSEQDLDRIIVSAIDRYTMDIRRWDGDRNQLDTFKQIRYDLAAIYNAVLGVKSEKFDVDELAKALANQLPQTDIDALVKALGEKLVNS